MCSTCCRDAATSAISAAPPSSREPEWLDVVLRGLLDTGDGCGQPVPRHVVGGLGERAERAREGT
ncbi:hypothetical protein [Streptomyces sp. NBC_00299]|uniref:hypothetical protein n=1 Tax=Streptomyces sp. NBC_00299 TaxID=2975705 RepID=UPI002E2CA5A0|nr:hypothetical protein [Streptomyces sp. NBC_00299]